MADHEATRGLADINAVVAVGGMAQDPFVLFIESVHGRPGERHSCLQFACVGRQVDVLPCSARHASPAGLDLVPGREPEVGVLCGVLRALQRALSDIALRKIGHWITAGLEEHENVLAIGDPHFGEQHPHTPAEPLYVQQSLGQWFGHEKPADRTRREGTLLPGQPHRHRFSWKQAQQDSCQISQELRARNRSSALRSESLLATRYSLLATRYLQEASSSSKKQAASSKLNCLWCRNNTAFTPHRSQHAG